jgi:catalase
MRSIYVLAASVATVLAACPYMDGQYRASPPPDHPPELHRRDSTPDNSDASGATEEFLSKFYIDNNNTFLTSDVGGPISDQNSLSAGDRGPTLLEDFIFRQKIQHFDHERVSIFSQFLRLQADLAITGSRTCCTCQRSR